jgi:hypothetical protein
VIVSAMKVAHLITQGSAVPLSQAPLSPLAHTLTGVGWSGEGK